MFTSAHHALGAQRAAIGQMAYAVARFRRGLVSAADDGYLRGEAGARTTKYRPQFAFPRGVSRGCVARVFAPSASCSQESRQSRGFVSLLRSIPPLPAHAALRGATRSEEGASSQVLLDRFVDGESGRAWRVTFNSLGRSPRPYAERRMNFFSQFGSRISGIETLCGGGAEGKGVLPRGTERWPRRKRRARRR